MRFVGYEKLLGSFLIGFALFANDNQAKWCKKFDFIGITRTIFEIWYTYNIPNNNEDANYFFLKFKSLVIF